MTRVRNRQVLAECIRLSGLSERAFAARAGLAHATVNHLITGRRVSCSPPTAYAIEQALDCAPGTLFVPGAG
ncbi:helix-turn-helix transcriptional regulator [Jatrophihabitans telluris]|uniref:Helix-turn-helix transcriptional regulator n=1 Tax=Jatrophihabitans telluris TaxID=2038343 RepID=A0ABY4R2R9_9ACTN|nr:helix-turn-helix transcriptional regulator [Jatrophihabitans telluris]UQX89334.1 helix-turn-helix transcriptional regulator [Jatrophihabitans telluris]